MPAITQCQTVRFPHASIGNRADGGVIFICPRRTPYSVLRLSAASSHNPRNPSLFRRHMHGSTPYNRQGVYHSTALVPQGRVIAVQSVSTVNPDGVWPLFGGVLSAV
jgi:hypothetical protein